MSYMSAELFLDAMNYIIHDNSAESKILVRTILDEFDEESKKNTSVDIELLRLYASILRDILDQTMDITSTAERGIVLLKFKNNPLIIKDPSIYAILEEIFNTNTPLSDLRLKDLESKIRYTLTWNLITKKTRKIYSTLNSSASSTDKNKKSKLLEDALELSREIVSIPERFNKPSTGECVEKIDFSDKESLKAGLKNHQIRKVHTKFVTGWQGLNKMFGERGGISLGESICFNALSHHYKSGMLLNCARWIAQYNTPSPTITGIPTILFISLENEASENMMSWFKSAYTLMNQKEPVELSDDDIIDFLYDFFNNKGYKLVVERRLGHDFGFKEYVELYEKYENSGRRIVASIVDYMNMMKRHSASGAETSDWLGIKNLFTCMCNFNKNKGTTLITAHQLNKEAAALASSGITNVVKRFSEAHMANSQDIHRELDFDAYMYIEHNQFGVPYLTVKRGKHRYVDNTPEVDKYFAYRFTKYGIQDDINGAPGYVRNIYADDPEDGEMVLEEETCADTQTRLSKKKGNDALADIF